MNHFSISPTDNRGFLISNTTAMNMINTSCPFVYLQLAEAARRNDRLLSRLRRVKAKVGVKLGASGGSNLPVKRRGASGRTKLKRLGH